MGELDAELCGPGATAEIDDALKGRFGFVRIKPHAAMGDATVAFHVGRLDDDEASARIRQHAEMCEVPVGGAAIDGAVLAHGRYDDTIIQFEAAELDRRKQGAGHEVRTMRKRKRTIRIYRSQPRLQPACRAGRLCRSFHGLIDSRINTEKITMWMAPCRTVVRPVASVSVLVKSVSTSRTISSSGRPITNL